MLKAFASLFYFECVSHLRRKHEWLYPLGFFLIVMTLFPLCLTPDTTILRQYVIGFIWLAVLLSSLLSINHVFIADIEDSHLEQALLSHLPLTLIVMAKLSAQWLFGSLPFILLAPLLALFFHAPIEVLPALLFGLFVGTPIITLIGSFAVALTLGLKHQGILLGLIMLPLLIPVLIFGINLAQQAQEHLPLISGCFFLLGLCVLSMTLLPCAIAYTLRISLDD